MWRLMHASLWVHTYAIWLQVIGHIQFSGDATMMGSSIVMGRGFFKRIPILRMVFHPLLVLIYEIWSSKN